MKRDVALLVAHVLAVAGAAFGLTVLVPYPQLWQHLPGAGTAYALAMQHAGPLHIVLGALAMLGFGAHAIGVGRTAIFFLVSTTLSLAMELLGTGTGWPFGTYAYTQGLGSLVGGRVPWSIPLSWFYVGFTSYLLARLVLGRFREPPSAWATIALGTWFLVAWDLVLDPAMAHPELPVRFWVWHDRGSFLIMPLVNLVGWALCGALFMGISRLLWGGDVDPARIDRRYVFAMYVVNVFFGVVLCGSLGLWQPILMAAFAGLLPASLVGAEAVPSEGEG